VVMEHTQKRENRLGPKQNIRVAAHCFKRVCQNPEKVTRDCQNHKQQSLSYKLPSDPFRVINVLEGKVAWPAESSS
jgi:hypothetical protein